MKSSPAKGFADVPLRTVANDADGSVGRGGETVRANPLKNNDGTIADGADANITNRSGLGERKGAGWRGRL